MIVCHKYNFDEVLKKDFVGKPMTPGYWVTKTLKTIPVTDLLITFGGGMGGVNKHFYIKRIELPDLCTKGMMEVETWDGCKYVINSNYIVYAKQMWIAVGIYHSENNNFKVGDWEYAYLLEDNLTIQTR